MRATRLVTVANPNYEVVVFMQPDGSAEVMVGQADKMPTRLRVPPPPEGRRIAVQRNPDGSVEVEYRDG